MIIERNGFLSQSCEADIVLMPAGKDMMRITFNKYKGRVSILRAWPARPFQGADLRVVPARAWQTGATSNEFEEKIYKRLDLTALRVAIATGEHPVAMKVRTRDGEKMTYKLTGASKDKKTGKEIFSVKAVSGSLLPALRAINGASIEIIGPIAVPYLSGLPALSVAPASWDAANQKLIVLPHDNDRDCYLFVQVLNSAITNKIPVVVEAMRVGSTKKEKMVSNVSSYKVSGNNIELNLSREGLKSKGKFARIAVTGFSSGKYTIQSIQLSPSHDLFNDDGFDNGYPTISVAAGLLEKTGNGPVFELLGAFELKFKVDRKERLLSFDEKKKEVSSVSISGYLRNFEIYLRRASNEVGGGADWVGLNYWPQWASVGGSALLGLRLSDGNFVVGEITRLRNNNGMYIAYINFAYSDAEELKNKTSVETLFWVIKV